MSDAHSVLVVDDDAAMREMLVSLLEGQGLCCASAPGAEAALEQVREQAFDAVISDIRMPGRDGVELVGEILELRAGTPVILMTAFGSIDSAVGAMRAGAFDYVTKPFKRDAILASLERAFERRALEEENRVLRRAVDRSTSFGDLIGASPAMHEIFALIRKVASSRSNVLITGESGTGKDVVARTLHFSGARRDKPFVPINCTAMPEGLLESELFGHVRGAFTGAATTRAGYFDEAKGGTLFLDEIGEMPLDTQVKLLRAVESGEIRPLGASEPVRVDVRLLAATNSDLTRAVEEGRFREDLFYRLNVVPIQLPPVRERKGDVPLLVNHFLKQEGRVLRIEPEAIQAMERYEWPGNVREIGNAMRRACALLSGDVLRLEDLPPRLIPQEAPGAGPRRLADVERQAIVETLDEYDGDRSASARVLGIDRSTLYRKMKRYGIEVNGRGLSP